jgi:predicted nucleic acid-binding protein
MATLFTIDASVFVAACRLQEPGYASSRAFLAVVRDQAYPLIEPAILPVEIASALIRTGSSRALAREYALAMEDLPMLTLVTLDGRLARQAVETAISSRLRSADAVYATVAAHFGARLVTLDEEQLSRAPAGVAACRPVEFHVR